MIGESHSGNMETLWHGGKHFICSRPHSGFGKYSLPTCLHCLSKQGVGGFRGAYLSIWSAASTLSLWVLHGQREACESYI